MNPFRNLEDFVWLIVAGVLTLIIVIATGYIVSFLLKVLCSA